MWYEALPAAAIIAALLVSPQISAYYLNNWMCGSPMRLKLETRWSRHMLLRDGRIVGESLDLAGLEQIPDQ